MKNIRFRPLLLLIVVIVVLVILLTAMAAKADAPTSPLQPSEQNPHIHPPEWNPYGYVDELARFYESLATSTTTAQAQYEPQQVEQKQVLTESTDENRWDQLAQCESGGNWSYGLVAGTFSGGLMFATSTWIAQGGGEFAPFPHMATREQQIVIAERTLASGGWGQWPGCSRKFGWL
jgi:hypothetical protein